MKIGELATATGTSARSLRHYEKQGLLHPLRSEAGYRLYAPDAAKNVQRIRWLLAAGFTTRKIREILPCVADGATRTITCAKVRADFDQELLRIRDQIRALEQSSRLLRTALAIKIERH